MEDKTAEHVRPYPVHYVAGWTMPDGTPVTIRPIRPEDEPLMVKFHESLSEQSVYFRYFHPLKLSQRVIHERLARLCGIDYDREMALVAERREPQTGTKAILGIGRLTRFPGTREAEFAVIISDRFQGRGLGSELIRRLIEVARAEKLSRVLGDVLLENTNMLQVCGKLGFHCRPVPGDTRAELEISL